MYISHKICKLFNIEMLRPDFLADLESWTLWISLGIGSRLLLCTAWSLHVYKKEDKSTAINYTVTRNQQTNHLGVAYVQRVWFILLSRGENI